MTLAFLQMEVDRLSIAAKGGVHLCPVSCAKEPFDWTTYGI